MLWLKVILRYGHFKFFSLDQKKGPKEGLEVATPENLKWKKYIRQSQNANGSTLDSRASVGLTKDKSYHQKDVSTNLFAILVWRKVLMVQI